MAVDNTGHDELPRGVDDLSVFRRIHGLADFGDLAVLNQDGAMLDGSMRDGEDGGVSNHNDGGRVRRRGSSRKWETKEIKEAKDVKKSEVLCVEEGSRYAFHCAPPSTAAEVDELLVGLTPLKSSEKPRTLILPFKEVPSNVPEKVTSDGDPSSGMLMVKLNLSTLR